MSTTGSRATAPRKRTAKPRLSSERILEAGLELAARPGVTSISVRELGAELGVDPTAVYRHFRSKEELMQALLDQLHLRANAALTATPNDWDERLRQLSIAILTEFVTHPAIAAEAVVLTTHGPGESSGIECMLEAFEHAGLDEKEVVRHYALLASHVLSVGAGIARNLDAGTVEGLETSRWFDAPLLADPRSHPRLAHYSPRITAFGDRELFLLGVEAVIESAERHSAD